METVTIRGVVKQKDDLGMLPNDAAMRFNIASKIWIAIREKGLDSEAATNEIERGLFEFWSKATPRVVVHAKPGTKRKSALA